jgi:Holliday junction resolvase RusA-like endonuclease
VNYENLVKLTFRQAYPNAEPIAAKVEVIAKIKAYYPIPASTSKKLQARMRTGLMKPTTKPDTDNIAKICLDALNGIAYHDDAQIVELQVSKLYSDEPRVVVWLAVIEA